MPDQLEPMPPYDACSPLHRHDKVTYFLGDDCSGGHMDEEVVFHALIAQDLPAEKARALIRRIKGEQDAD